MRSRAYFVLGLCTLPARLQNLSDQGFSGSWRRHSVLDWDDGGASIYFWHFLVFSWALSTLWQSLAMVGVLVVLGLSLPAPNFYGKLSWFPCSPALGFKLKYVFLVMLGKLFCLLYQVFKDGEGMWDFYHILFGASGDSNHGGWLEDTLELSLQGVLEECERLGGRSRLEPPSAAAAAAAVVILTERGQEGACFSLSIPVSHMSLLWRDSREEA